MFTGLIQTIGTLQPLREDEFKITCSRLGAERILADLALGDSVAVDGVCLTVEDIVSQGFIATASPETLRRTTLGQLSAGALVNLEASLRVGSKIGGHFVTGHVDGRGRLDAAVQTASAWEISFSVLDTSLARYVVPKGSIAVNGISLTVAECTASGNGFKVAVIPVTYTETTLQYLQPGHSVNLEGDVLGKYVEKFLHLGHTPAVDGDGDRGFEHRAPSPGHITPAFLAEHGY